MPALAPASTDADAGSWKMIVLSGPAQVNVPAPAATSDPSYQSELESIRSAQAQLSTKQRDAIAYWSSGGVLRWNQILRELVSSADLPPAPAPDGSYPIPDPNNPFADPRYPFGNPPYAARAYSYVAVAQYEALKVAWYYKQLYRRPAPAKIDSRIQALMPVTDLPAYPSEDAVLAGVTAEVLKLLFPTAVETISSKAAEQRNAALWSGKARASDIAAGLALGQAIAPLIIARASSDGMRAAGGTSAQWQAMAESVTANGEVAWRSLEVPPRPPMLPLFGKVKAWAMSPEQVLAERPLPPPSTSSAQMAAELADALSGRNVTRCRCVSG